MSERDPLLPSSSASANLRDSNNSTPTFEITPPSPNDDDEIQHDREHEQELYEGRKGSFIVIKDKKRQRIWGNGRCFTFALIWLVLIVCVVILAVFFRLEDANTDNTAGSTSATIVDIVYPHAAVAADIGQCSEMGRDILQRGGSAVDGAITSLLCLGVINSESSGLGGGLIMTVYTRKDQSVETVVATERAPMRSSSGLYAEDPDLARSGPIAVAVPGEIAGLWEAHQRYGSLQWEELFQPVIELARDGYALSQHAQNILDLHDEEGWPKYCDTSSGINKLYQNEDGSYKRAGDIVKNEALAETLQRIAVNGAQEFYNGEIAKNIVADLQAMGGILTLDDLTTYATEIQHSPSITFGDKLTLHTSALPSLGHVLLYQMNVMDEYDIKPSDFASVEKKILLHHRFIEAMKFASPVLPFLGHNMTEEGEKVLNKLISDSFAKQVASAINDTHVTYPKLSDYNLLVAAEEGLQFKSNHHGTTFDESPDTTHVSVVAENGDAVSVTSSVGHYFGSCMFSNSTGIFYNNHMSNYVIEEDGLPNSVVPGELFLTSRTPSIVTDSEGVRMVVGGSGGAKIGYHVAWVLLRTLLTKADLSDATEERRLVFAMFDNIYSVQYEDEFPVDILNGLQSMGHNAELTISFSVVQSILRTSGGYGAHSDQRKDGYPAGY